LAAMKRRQRAGTNVRPKHRICRPPVGALGNERSLLVERL
jgi:hypothetical protein